MLVISYYRSSHYIIIHLLLILPVSPDLSFLGSELLNVFFYLLAEQDLLQTDERAIFERQTFILKQLIEIGSELSPVELQKTVVDLLGTHRGKLLLPFFQVAVVRGHDHNRLIRLFCSLSVSLVDDGGHLRLIHCLSLVLRLG